MWDESSRTRRCVDFGCENRNFTVGLTVLAWGVESQHGMWAASHLTTADLGFLVAARSWTHFRRWHSTPTRQFTSHCQD